MLTKKSRRGYKFPKRITITGAVLLLEFIVIVSLTSITGKYLYWAYSFFEFLSIVAVIIIVNKQGKQEYKLTWIIFILGIPFAGWLIYLIFGGNRVFPYLKKRYLKIDRRTDNLRIPDKSACEQLLLSNPEGAKIANYLYTESGYPLYRGTDTEFFESGEDVFAALKTDLKSAKTYIFMEFFIVADGFMWDDIHAILLERIHSGVEVRLIFDDFGSANRQYRDFVKDLRDEGIKVAIFNPIRPSSNLFLNNRNHRKMAVIDGRIAYTGGFNIADEYINRLKRFGHWLDCGIRLQGEAVKSFTVMFCNMWSFTKVKDPLDAAEYINPAVYLDSVGFAQPYCDGPFDDHHAGEGLYLQLINRAKKYIYIASPYLIVDNDMLLALRMAAKSGVDVRIICPKKWDKWYVHPVTQYHYSYLLASGVKIYEYTPGFIHSKLFCTDDTYATVGTFNMDYRSFYFHFECGVWLCNTNSVPDIKNHLLETIEKSEEIELDKWRKRPLKQKAKQFLLHLFAPFM